MLLPACFQSSGIAHRRIYELALSLLYMDFQMQECPGFVTIVTAESFFRDYFCGKKMKSTIIRHFQKKLNNLIKRIYDYKTI